MQHNKQFIGMEGGTDFQAITQLVKLTGRVTSADVIAGT